MLLQINLEKQLQGSESLVTINLAAQQCWNTILTCCRVGHAPSCTDMPGDILSCTDMPGDILQKMARLLSGYALREQRPRARPHTVQVIYQTCGSIAMMCPPTMASGTSGPQANTMTRSAAPCLSLHYLALSCTSFLNIVGSLLLATFQSM